ncbi:helix-turn-helix domain-containing protein [Streptomyces pseudovenezuelae]|uniref:Transcriptional regulator with XRE-family HTH domain n=1 Tax=Streptomyces pseudovenezuelae TaxID=67350 RepID=A0ABT6LYV8_9ACTN|nr:transcriptional regulator with XRE-family HTH domain [Streptomyces pseudovenezuelae]
MTARTVGDQVAYYRSVARSPMTQQQLADATNLSLGAVRKIEQGERRPSPGTLEAIADAFRIDPNQLLTDRGSAQTRVHAALPALSAVLSAYDLPDDGPVRPMSALRASVEKAADWKLAAQYTPIARARPSLLSELLRGYHSAGGDDRRDLAGLLVSAARSADAAAYKIGARVLSARMIDLMRWVIPEAQDPVLESSVAYVRTETFSPPSPTPPGCVLWKRLSTDRRSPTALLRLLPAAPCACALRSLLAE